MLPDIGATELLVIAIVALIVVGPKDLPVLMRRVGQFMAKLRGMAAEFRASFDEMARQSELDELRKEVEAMRRGQVFQDAAADATNVEVNQVLGEIEQSLADTGVQFHPPMSHPYGETTMTALPEPAEPAPQATKPKATKPKAPRKPAAKPKASTKAKAKPASPEAAAAPARKPRAKKAGAQA